MALFNFKKLENAMEQNAEFKIAKAQWEKLTFCKFRGLVYDNSNEGLVLSNEKCENCEKYCEKYKANFYFKEILENRALYMSDFSKFNDIDEGRYYFYQEDNKRNEKLVEAIRDEKLSKNICSFSLCNDRANWDLMWAYYANSHCGVKIDFKINPSYKGDIYKVRYDNHALCCELNEIPERLMEIMTTKKQCFKHEREYRVISDSAKTLPIIITKITLGRRFSRNLIDDKRTRNGSFGDNIYKIAEQILNLWRSGVKRGSDEISQPEIWAYKSVYATEPQRVF